MKSLFAFLFCLLAVPAYSQQSDRTDKFEDYYFDIFHERDTFIVENSERRFNARSLNTAFSLYSITKLWQEDSCGKKGYRSNVFEFLTSVGREGALTPGELKELLGQPFSVTVDGKLTFYFYTIKQNDNCDNSIIRGSFVYHGDTLKYTGVSDYSSGDIDR